MNPKPRKLLSTPFGRQASPSVVPYLISLSLQSIVALTITFAIHRAFQIVIDDLGVLHANPLSDLIMLIAVMGAFQASYWHRIARIDIPE